MISPSMIVMAVLVAATPITYLVTKAHAIIQIQAAEKAAYAQGHSEGVAEAKAAGDRAVAATTEALRASEGETAIVKGKPELLALCKKSASCRERSVLP